MRWIALCLTLAANLALAGQAQLSWTAPTQYNDGAPLTDLAGYRVYSRCNAEPVSLLADVPHPQTTYMQTGIPDDGRTCWWSLTAYNATGTESARTNEVTKTFAAAPPSLPGQVTASFTWSIAAPPEQPSVTFPSIRSQTSNGTAGNTTTPSATLPATIEAGDLLLIIVAQDSIGDTLSEDSATWTALLNNYGSTGHTGHVFAKIASGTEDGGSVTFTAAGPENFVFQTFAIQDWWGTISTGVAVSNTETTSTTVNPDPPNLAHGWGAGLDVLWFANAHCDGTVTVSSYPSGYANGVLLAPGAGGGPVSLATSQKNANAESDDPGVFTLGAAEHAVTTTIAVRPAAGGAVVMPNRPTTINRAVARAAYH